FHEAVEALNELQSEIRLGIARITLAKEWLTVQIGQFDHIIVDDRQRANARSGKGRDDRATDPARADDRDICRLELALSHSPDLQQDDVPRVAFEFLVGEAHWPVEPKPPAPRLV